MIDVVQHRTATTEKNQITIESQEKIMAYVAFIFFLNKKFFFYQEIKVMHYSSSNLGMSSIISSSSFFFFSSSLSMMFLYLAFRAPSIFLE